MKPIPPKQLEAIYSTKGGQGTWRCGVQSCQQVLATVESNDRTTLLLPEGYDWNSSRACYEFNRHPRHTRRKAGYKRTIAELREQTKQMEEELGYVSSGNVEDVLADEDFLNPIELTIGDLPACVTCPQCKAQSIIKSMRGLPRKTA